MRPITQSQAEQMREALREIAGFHNAAYDPRGPGQAAAIKARETLEGLGLFSQKDAQPSSDQATRETGA